MVNNCKQVVATLLEFNKSLRDDDLALCIEVWKDQAEVKHGIMDLDKVPTSVFWAMLQDGKLTHPSSIMRCRRKLQQTYYHLRGYKYNKRHKNQAKVLEDLNAIALEGTNPSY